MLTKLTIRNFKQFDEVEIELGDNVVLIGPNNSGKTSALQALALWELGIRRRNGNRTAAGIALGRSEIVTIPVPDTQHLWRSVRPEDGPIEIVVDGTFGDASWTCGLSFTYANDQSLYCSTEGGGPVPEGAQRVRVGYLPSMSGMTAIEDRLELGSIAVRLGQGRTAEVLRNVCLRVRERPGAWERVTARIDRLFGIAIEAPLYDPATGQIGMSYVQRGRRLDLSASGRGMQQTLLLLAYLELMAGSVLLLDEPDAHLEVLRQRQTYEMLTEAAAESGSQIIAASHSEVLLDAAGDTSVVVAFVGRPHRIDDRAKKDVGKALKEIGFDQYYQAMQRGWVLYLEGSTDLSILRALASVAGHPAASVLERAFVKFIGGNQRATASRHFFGLREAKADLVGVLLLDRDAVADESIRAPLRELRWRRQEIENYLSPLPEVLGRFASSEARDVLDEPLLRGARSAQLEDTMRRVVLAGTPPNALASAGNAFWRGTRVSKEYLPEIFGAYYAERGLPNRMNKSDYHVLARFMDAKDVDPEVIEKLDAIALVAAAAKPEGGE